MGKQNKQELKIGDSGIAANGLFGNRVFVSMAKTVNLGNYESMKVECGVERVVQDGQSFEEVKEQCKVDVLETLTEMVAMVEDSK